MPLIELALLVAALVCGIVGLVESGGRDIASAGVALIALVLLLPVLPL